VSDRTIAAISSLAFLFTIAVIGIIARAAG
jgi:hypothetical protein